MKEPDRWKDVLRTLKVEMECLEWLSLRRIGYAGTEQFMNGGGAEVPDDADIADGADGGEDADDIGDANLSASTESSEADEPPEAGPSYQYPNEHGHDDNEFDLDHSSDGNEDDEDGPGANETDFPPEVLAEAEHNEKQSWNDITRFYSDADVDLEDDGGEIDRPKSKLWEEWVIRHRRRR